MTPFHHFTNGMACLLQARDLARDDLIGVLTGRSGDAVNWLQDKFALDLSKVSRLGGHSQPRTHRGDAQFPGMVSCQIMALFDQLHVARFRSSLTLKWNGSKTSPLAIPIVLKL
jgi:hypothetical protein